MIWFGKSLIKFCKSFINLIKLVSTRTSSSARVRSSDSRPSNLIEINETLSRKSLQGCTGSQSVSDIAQYTSSRPRPGKPEQTEVPARKLRKPCSTFHIVKTK